MQHVDANNFVSAPGAMQARYDSDPAPGLNRRSSVLEPIGAGAYPHNGYGYDARSPTEYSGGVPDSASPMVPLKHNQYSQAAAPGQAAGVRFTRSAE